jgi:hypothetical protein
MTEDAMPATPEQPLAAATAPLPVPPQPEPVAYQPLAPPQAAPVAYQQPAPPAYGQPYMPMPLSGAGALGKVRGTGICMLLAVVTLGIYPIVWYYKVHEEMKRHRGTGLGGGLALVLAIFVGIAMPYLTSSEVGDLYEGRGHAKPVSGLTGLWSFPGVVLIVGPIVWFVKTNGALNAYWRSLGAR